MPWEGPFDVDSLVSADAYRYRPDDPGQYRDPAPARIPGWYRADVRFQDQDDPEGAAAELEQELNRTFPRASQLTGTPALPDPAVDDQIYRDIDRLRRGEIGINPEDHMTQYQPGAILPSAVIVHLVGVDGESITFRLSQPAACEFEMTENANGQSSIMLKAEGYGRLRP